MELMRIEHLTKVYGSGENAVHAVDDVTFSVEKGEFLAIIGPSGSGKREITEALCGSRGTGASERAESGEIFVRPVNYCTEPGRYGHKSVPEEAFDRMNFFEKTAYAGVRYGTRKEDIQTLLDQGKFAVIPVDMCGAIAMKRHYPTVIIFCSHPYYLCGER